MLPTPSLKPTRLGQLVRREQQDTVGAGALRRASQFDSGGRAVTRRCDDREAGRCLLYGGGDDPFDLRRGQREKLTRAASGEQAGGRALRQPGNVLPVAGLVEGVVVAEVGDGKGQQAGTQLPGERGGGVIGHEGRSPGW